MMRPKLLIAVLAALLLTAALPARQPAAAQDQGQLEQYVARTGEIVEQAGAVVGESDSPRARRVLREAVRWHERSVQRLQTGRPRLAFSLSQRARRGARQAIRFARDSGGHQERARMRLERYTELHDQLADRAHEAGDERALRFLRESQDQARRAGDHHRQGNHAMALNLLAGAETLLERAARLLFEGGGAARLAREIARTEDLIARTADRLQTLAPGPREDATAVLGRAREALAGARQAADRGQPLRALQSLRVARRLASQAAAAGGELTAEAVAAQLARWDDRAGAVAGRVESSGSQEAAALLARARDHRERAGRLTDAGDLEPALRQLKAAFDLLDEANERTR